MKAKKILQQRTEIRTHLGEIVEHAKSIDEIIVNIPHKRGLIYRSLKPRSVEYIVGSPKGFVSFYKDIDGEVYEINIHRRKSK